MATRRFSVKEEFEGREYWVSRANYDVKENADKKAAELHTKTGRNYWVVFNESGM